MVIPLRSPLISSKLCPFFILATWIVAMAVISPYLFAMRLVEEDRNPDCSMKWNDAFGESLSSANYYLAQYIVFYYIPIASLVKLYFVIVIKLKSQKIPGEQSVNAEQQRAKRNFLLHPNSLFTQLSFVVIFLILELVCAILF